MSKPIVPIILCGGTGTRLWPLSRAAMPKQLLALAGPETMLQETVQRIAAHPDCTAPLLVSHADHRFLVAEQCRRAGIAPAGHLVEPASRNTALAAATAILVAAERFPDAVVALFPADHVIGDRGAFLAALSVAAAAARAGRLVTFGIRPTRPETGYGYIRAGEPLGADTAVLAIDRFVEKPDRETAAAYLRSGDYLWNSGMFVLHGPTFLEEVRSHAPETAAAAAQAVRDRREDGPFLWLDEAAVQGAPSISIDHAVMEPTRKGAVVPAALDWSDLGAWSALWEQAPRDAQGNARIGPTTAIDVRNSYLRSEGRQLVAALGLEDIVVVSSDDAVLVAPMDRAAEVGQLVRQLQEEGRDEATLPAVVHRPWGTYEDLAEGEGFRVKRIVVVPGGRLSLQYHHHRSEHWVVVAGQATVTRAREVVELGPNQSIYIPLGEHHRLENRGSDPVVLIEVQYGRYTGEDDIVRLEDVYGRLPDVPGERG